MRRRGKRKLPQVKLGLDILLPPSKISKEQASPKGSIKLIDPEDLEYENDLLKDERSKFERIIQEQELYILDLDQSVRTLKQTVKSLEESNVRLRKIIAGNEQEKLNAMRFIRDNASFLEIT
jgi:exonuclease VII small subunit